MANKDIGVFQLENGYWGYRYVIQTEAGQREGRRTTDDMGQPFKTKTAASKARQQAIVNEQIRARSPTQSKKKRVTVREVWEEYCEHGRSGKAYATIKKQDSRWKNHICDKFGKRYVDDISVAEVNDYLSHLYNKEGRAYGYVESFLKMSI